jgi:hypothetical protein
VSTARGARPRSISDYSSGSSAAIRCAVSGGGCDIASASASIRWSAPVSWDAFVQGGEEWRADAALARELADLLPETTDDVPIP